MALVIKLEATDQLSINGELVITAKALSKGYVKITFDGPKDKYEILRLSTLKKTIKKF